MSAKRVHRRFSDYLQYLKRDLGSRERHELERELEADAFEREAMEGFESIRPSELEDDLLSLHAALHRRLKRRRRIAWYRIAASIASILIIGTIFIQISQVDPKQKEDSIPETEYPAATGMQPEEAFDRQESSVESGPADAQETAQEAAKEGVQEAAQEAAEEAFQKGAQETERQTEEEKGPAAGSRKKQEDRKTEAQVKQALRRAEPAAAEPAEEEVPLAEAPVTVEMQEIQVLEAKEMPDTDKMPDEGEVLYADEMKKAPEVREKAAAPGRSVKGLATRTTYEADMAAPAGSLIEGVVLSSDELAPLPGATLMLQGENKGLLADMDGRFILESVASGQRVTASFIGMQNREQALKSGMENRILMEPDPQMLHEQVLIEPGIPASQLEVSPTGKMTITEPDPEAGPYQAAAPEGGPESFKTHIKENIRFPEEETRAIRSIVVLRFCVQSNGRLTDIQTLRSPGENFSREALRLLEEGPAWIPAADKNGPIASWVRIRILFKESE